MTTRKQSEGQKAGQFILNMETVAPSDTPFREPDPIHSSPQPRTPTLY